MAKLFVLRAQSRFDIARDLSMYRLPERHIQTLIQITGRFDRERAMVPRCAFDMEMEWGSASTLAQFLPLPSLGEDRLDDRRSEMRIGTFWASSRAFSSNGKNSGKGTVSCRQWPELSLIADTLRRRSLVSPLTSE